VVLAVAQATITPAAQHMLEALGLQGKDLLAAVVHTLGF
jgi:hypothetical protein